MARRLLLLVALLTVVGGCKDPRPATQVMLEVRADEELHAAADNVVVVVYDQEGTKKLEREFNIGGDGVDWPIRVALVPLNGDATRVFEATATARAGSMDLASARVISGYLEEQSLLLSLHIYNQCRGVPCEQDETCDALGLCTDAEVDPCDTERLEGGGQPSCGDRDAGSPTPACMDGFGAPVLLETVNSPEDDCCASLTGDGRDLYFASGRSGGWGTWVAHREARGEPFGAPVQVTIESVAYPGEPAVTSDGSRLYFKEYDELLVAPRRSSASEFGAAVALEADLSGLEAPDGPDLTADGLLLLLTDKTAAADSRDLFVLSRSDVRDSFGVPVLALDAPGTEEAYGAITADGLGVYFHRVGELYYAERDSRDVPFGTPVRLPLNDELATVEDPEISDDGTELFFNSDALPGGAGGDDILVARCR